MQAQFDLTVEDFVATARYWAYRLPDGRATPASPSIWSWVLPLIAAALIGYLIFWRFFFAAPAEGWTTGDSCIALLCVGLVVVVLGTLFRHQIRAFRIRRLWRQKERAAL